MAAGNSTATQAEPDVTDGPFEVKELLRIDQALTAADANGRGLKFSVYVGPLHDPVRGAAEAMHDQLEDPDHSILIAISPQQRQLEVVTGKAARERVPDRQVSLAVFSMEASFGAGNLAEGIVTGLRMLGEQAAHN
ncbi:DUF5130 family protein [Natronoglycomyces albus]|uniref:DUF5130 family protein n=1 Tax=Natronoglycomyces albus TaxID=2811108 RepID=A0A895XRD1_9ACTN|nr:DUF5130 family protein [Natronoglycomyces albus]QSB06272.1 DUF5130 family protein [Natronoglycomyces albus]